MFLALAVLACVIPAQASAASNSSVPDVPASFWAHAQITWAVKAGWVPLHKNGTFAPGRDATRTAAARVLANLNQQQHGVAVSDDPFQQAVDGGWIGAGPGPGSTLTQLQFDRGIVRVMGLKNDSIRLRQITAADGWKPKLPTGFAAEQIVRDIGARWNVPFGADNWETWPSSTLRRANLAVQAYLLGHLPSYWQSSVDTQMNVVHALPEYPPLKKAVLGYALKWAGAPYIWGGSSDQPQDPFGLPAAAGFDCSGYVWWVMKRAYTVPGKTWDGTAKIPWRTTYDMAAHLPVAKRITYKQPEARRHPVLEQQRTARRADQLERRRPHRHLPRERLDDQQPRQRRGRHHQLHGPRCRLVPRQLRVRLAGHAGRRVSSPAR